jgi:hypothetical protein
MATTVMQWGKWTMVIARCMFSVWTEISMNGRCVYAGPDRFFEMQELTALGEKAWANQQTVGPPPAPEPKGYKYEPML